MKQRHIGIFGGTFDPVHLGHLRTALELLEQLQFDTLLLIPVGMPPHRAQPMADPRQRLAMLQLAVGGEPRIKIDDRECRKRTVAYSVDTLRDLRAELGEQTALSFCVGADAFLEMHRWRRWQELPDLAHIVVMSRPGWCLPPALGALECWRERFLALAGGSGGAELIPAAIAPGERAQLRRERCGRIVFPALTPVDISATRVRRRVAMGQSARFLVPDSVWRYIQRNGLYQPAVSRRQPEESMIQGDTLTGEQ